MKIVEKDDEIFIRDTPAINWANGILALVGGFLFGAAAFFSPAAKVAAQPVGFGQIVCSALAAFCFYWAYIKLSAPVITTRIRVPAQTIDVTRRKFLFFVRTERVHFSQIKRAEMVERKPERAFLYFSVLRLLDDSIIDLESSGNASETAAVIPLIINRLLKNSHPARSGKKRKSRLSDESKAEMR
jgi:hypothetical protein